MTDNNIRKDNKKSKIILSLIFISIFCLLLFYLFYGKNFDVLKEIFRKGATKSEIKASIDKLGIRSYIVVAILAMIQVIFTFIPGEPLHVISGISFGLLKGVMICFIGILIGNTIIFLLNKIYGQKLKEFFSTNVDFDFDSAKGSSKIALIVIMLYCLPAIPYGIICFFAASMNMKYSKYILITGVGSIPSLILDVGLGHIAMATSLIVSVIVFIAIIILLVLMWKFKDTIFKQINEWIKRSREKEKNKVGNFNGFVYNIVGNLLYLYVKSKVKIKLTSNVETIEQPSIVLCNHGAFYDFAYAGKLLKKKKPHFIVARLYFHNKIMNYALKGTGAFPKSMFTNDIVSLKNCLKVIAGNGTLAMMPEARLSTVGRFEGVQESTYKFLKKMAVPVYVIKINGSYLAKPKWADKLRKGSVVEAELSQIYTPEQLKEASVEEIKEKIDLALDYNEWDWLSKHPEVHYRHKNIAKGLENILYLCPKCGKKYTLNSNKNQIVCDECGLTVSLDERYQLTGVQFKNISQWYDWQVQATQKELESSPEFCLKANVELRHLSKDGKGFTRASGTGACVFNKDGLKYIGTEDGEQVVKEFKIGPNCRVLFGAGEDFEVYENDELYYFVPENKKECVEWYVLSELLK